MRSVEGLSKGSLCLRASLDGRDLPRNTREFEGFFRMLQTAVQFQDDDEAATSEIDISMWFDRKSSRRTFMEP